MIFTDHYRPSGDIRCFVCGKVLHDWTGHDGPCLDLTFHQGRPEPDLPPWASDPAEDGGPVLHPSAIDERLPDSFVISSGSCGCPFSNAVQGRAHGGVWTHSALLTGGAEDRRWTGPETREHYQRRMKWLSQSAASGDSDDA